MINQILSIVESKKIGKKNEKKKSVYLCSLNRRRRAWVVLNKLPLVGSEITSDSKVFTDFDEAYENYNRGKISAKISRKGLK